MSAQLDQLKITLENRKNQETGSLIFEDTDLGSSSASFSQLTGVNTLTFQRSTIDIAEETLLIGGTCALWQHQELKSLLAIVEVEGVLNFTLKCTMPADWSFASSFPTLTGVYYDNISLSGVVLTACNYTNSASGEVQDLQEGLNFYGVAKTVGSLAGLKILNQNIEHIVLTGLISKHENVYQIALSAPIEQALEIITTSSVFHLNNGGADNDKSLTPIASLSSSFQRQPYTYPTTIFLPAPSVLDILENSLRRRIAEDKLRILNTDFGPDVEQLVEEILWTNEITIAGPGISRISQDQLLITGKANVYQIGDDQELILKIIVTRGGRLDFELVIQPASDWKLSHTIPSVADSFFDDIYWTSTSLVATSFEHDYAYHEEQTVFPLISGLNFIGKTGSTHGALQRLQILGLMFESFYLSGTLIKKQDKFTVELAFVNAGELEVSSIGIADLAVASPNTLYLTSTPIDQEPYQVNRAFIGGLMKTGIFSFQGTLNVPMSFTDTSWVLEKDENSISLTKPGDLFDLIKSDTIAGFFPAGFTALNTLQIDEWTTEMRLEPLARNLTFWSVFLKDKDGSPQSWQILPRLAIGDLGFELEVSNYSSIGGDYATGMGCVILGTIQLGNTTAILVRLAVPPSADWVLQIMPKSEALPGLNDLAALGWATGSHSGQDFLNVLPSGLISGPEIQLKEIKIGFNPRTPDLSFISFDLVQQNVWHIIPGILELSDWSAYMKLDIRNDYAITAHIHGYAKISTIAEIEVSIDTEKGKTEVDLGLKEGTTIEFGSFANLLAIAQHDQPLGLPAGLEALGALTIDQLDINLNPGQAKPVNFFHFNLYGAKKWVIIDKWIEIENIRAALHIQKKGEDTYQNKGFISGIVIINEQPIWIYAGKDGYDEAWRFKLAIKQEILLPGLGALAKWMLPVKMLEYIPSAFMPFPDGFLIESLNIDFNLDSMYLENIDFSIRNRAPWEVIRNYVTFDHAVASAKVSVSKDDAETSALAVNIAADLILGEAILHFKADYNNQEVPNWHFIGELVNEVSFDFAVLLSKVKLDSIFSLPQYDWLPTLTISSAQADAQPELGKFYVDAAVSLSTNWDIPFLGLHLKMIGISGLVDMKHLDPEAEDKNFFKAALSGNLDFGTLKTRFSMILGGEGSDTVFTASLTAEETENFQLPAFVNGVVAGQSVEPNQNNWEDLRPDGMTAIAFDKIYAYYNYTKHKFFVYGSILNLGDAILLSQSVETDESITGEQKRGYLFGFALKPDFKFSNLFPVLAPIDEILIIRSAGITVNSYEIASAAQLVNEINEISSADRSPSTIENPIKQENLPSGKLVKGMHLFAALDFGSNLFSRFLQLEKTGTAPAVTLSATFATEASATIFKAIFAPFSILDTLYFKGREGTAGVLMQYTQENKNEFKLEGIVELQVFGGSYAFDGALMTNEAETRFSIVATLEREISLFSTKLPPLFTLEKLGLNLIYRFRTAESTQKYLTTEVYGEVKLLTIPLTAKLKLLNTKPVLAEISLTEDFSMTHIIREIVGGEHIWRDDFFDIKFLKHTAERPSHIYYYDAEADENLEAATDQVKKICNGFKSGYNLESTVELTFIKTISLSLAIQVIKDEGVIASVGLLQPINIFVLQLAGIELVDDKYQGGPLLKIDTTKSGEDQLFGFKTGVSFFQVPCGELNIKIGNKLSGGRQETKITTEVTLAKEVAPFGKLSLVISYCKSEGFTVAGWEKFSAIFDVIDVVKELKKIMESADTGLCGALTKFVISKAYQSKFSISPGFRTAEDASQSALYFQLHGTFSIYLAGGNDPVSTIDFPSMLEIALPDDISLENLPNMIKNVLADSAGSFMKGLINNGEQWAKVAGILFAEQALALGSELFCRQLVNTVTKAAITAAGAAVVKAGAAAAPAVIAAAASAAAAAIFSGKDGGGKSGGGGSGGPDAPAAPKISSLKYDESANHPSLITEWEAVSGVKYNFELHDENQKLAEETNSDIRQKTVNIDLVQNGGSYQAKVQARRGDKTSEWRILEIPKQVDPSSVFLSFHPVDHQLHLTWSSMGTSHQVTLFAKDQLEPIYNKQVDGMECTFDSSELPTGFYFGKVRALGHSHRVPSQEIVSNILTKLAEPTALHLQASGDSLELSFEHNGDGVAQYDIRVGDLQNPFYMVSIVNKSHTIDTSSFPSGEHNVYISAMGATIIPSNNAVAQVQKVSAPTNIVLSYVKEEAHIILNYDYVTPDAKATAILIELYTTDDHIVFTEEVEVGAGLPKIIPIAQLSGEAWTGEISARVKVKAESGTLDSSFEMAGNGIKRITEPATTLEILSGEQQIKLAWTTIEGNNGYRLRVVHLADNVVIMDQNMGKEVTTVDVRFSQLGNYAGPFSIQLSTIADDNAVMDSDFTIAPPVLRALSPSELSYTIGDIFEPLLVKWETEEASNCLLSILNTGDKAILYQEMLEEDSKECRINKQPLPEHEGPFFIQLVILGNDVKIDSLPTISSTFRRIGGVTECEAKVDLKAKEIHCTWANVDLTSGYHWKIENIKTNEDFAFGITVGTINDMVMAIPASLTAENEDVKFMIKALPSEPDLMASLYKVVDFEWPIDDLPVNVTLNLEDGIKFKGSWEYPDPEATFEVEVLDATYTPVIPQPRSIVRGKKVSIVTEELVNGKAYSFRVRSKTNCFVNVLKNGDGSDGLNNWDIKENRGDKWKIEEGPAASCFATDGNTNFVTSYQICKKAQTIDLLAEGLSQALLDQSPEIRVSEWMCSRADCQGMYRLYAELRDKEGNKIVSFDTDLISAPAKGGPVYPWEEISHCFKGYSGAVRYVYFEHSGIDTKKWAGHYGSKMTGARVDVRVRPSEAEVKGPWSVASNAVDLPLRVPAKVVLTSEGDAFKLKWESLDNGLDHDVELLAGNERKALDPQPEITIKGKEALIDKSGLPSGVEYFAKVRARTKSFVNVLKNGDGNDGLNSWKILDNGGHKWKTEQGPAATCFASEGDTSFVTSFNLCKKEQTIDLMQSGFIQEWLDQSPEIRVSEWICSRSDCQGKYRLYVELRDAEHRKIQSFDTGLILAPIKGGWVHPWKRISQCFKNYQGAVRYVYFEHSGIDSKWWAGHYGSKMTGARVEIRNIASDKEVQSEWSQVSNPASK